MCKCKCTYKYVQIPISLNFKTSHVQMTANKGFAYVTAINPYSKYFHFTTYNTSSSVFYLNDYDGFYNNSHNATSGSLVLRAFSI